MSLISEKKKFIIPEFEFTCGRVLPVEMGYETFGKLNEKKDNAILVVHFFSASSHCAGKYHESDELAGFWDGLIGPGKAIDTDRYFVVCSDNLCNTGVNNPAIITTGPKSIDPKTGRHYGISFPVPEVLDCVNAQKKLLESMGIEHLVAVTGPSFGGMSSWQWAVAYPDFMDKIIPVISTPKLPVWELHPLQAAIRIAKIDPKWNGGDYYDKEEQPVESRHLMLEMMNVAAFQAGFYERTYAREAALDKECYESVLGEATFEKKLDAVVSLTENNVDVNHWLYTCRMCLNFDVSRPYGGDIDKALGRIKAKVYAIACKRDILHPADFVQAYCDRVVKAGGDAQCLQIDSDYGHMAGIMQTELFADKMKAFLDN